MSLVERGMSKAHRDLRDGGLVLGMRNFPCSDGDTPNLLGQVHWSGDIFGVSSLLLGHEHRVDFAEPVAHLALGQMLLDLSSS